MVECRMLRPAPILQALLPKHSAGCGEENASERPVGGVKYMTHQEYSELLAEIERLRKDYIGISDNLQEYQNRNKDLKIEIERLEEENKRLRAEIELVSK